MKLNNFRGDLTDTSANKEALNAGNAFHSSDIPQGRLENEL